jgi:hypothetical protein
VIEMRWVMANESVAQNIAMGRTIIDTSLTDDELEFLRLWRILSAASQQQASNVLGAMIEINKGRAS